MDLRNQIRAQIAQGRSDDQIRDYMVERYGDFVLYRPPFHAATALLWVGPPLLIATGIGIFLRVMRRRPPAPASAVGAAQRGEIEALLEGREPPAPAASPPGRRKKRRPLGPPLNALNSADSSRGAVPWRALRSRARRPSRPGAPSRPRGSM